ncbi:Co2+/Mg2+ efflux protein ApaG [Burkholderiaceae bacterium UC74_6]
MSAKPELTIQVAVQPLPEETRPERGVWAYRYTVTIVNTGKVTAQVLGRHWRIFDARGRMQSVDGLAVVGHQPLLAPGQQFQYSSWAQIETPQGSMRGKLLCATDTAEIFYVEVEEFALSDTSALH